MQKSHNNVKKVTYRVLNMEAWDPHTRWCKDIATLQVATGSLKLYGGYYGYHVSSIHRDTKCRLIVNMMNDFLMSIYR